MGSGVDANGSQTSLTPSGSLSTMSPVSEVPISEIWDLYYGGGRARQFCCILESPFGEMLEVDTMIFAILGFFSHIEIALSQRRNGTSCLANSIVLLTEATLELKNSC